MPTKKGRCATPTAGGAARLPSLMASTPAAIPLLGAYIASEFVAASDGNGGTQITPTLTAEAEVPD